MKALKFILKSLWHRKATSLFIAFIWALGLVGLAMTSRLEINAEAQLVRTLEGTDFLLVAKGSPTQAILANVFHVDDATGNIPIEEAEKWIRHPDLSHVRRLAYGDTFKSYRILGCDSATWNHIPLHELKGGWPLQSLEAVISKEVADQTGLKLGDHFHGSHGTVDDLGDHDHLAYTVVGIANPKGTQWQRMIWTPLKSVWDMHEHAAPEYTAVLARIENPMTRVMLPGQIQKNSALMAVSPAMEANRMVGWLNQGGQILKLMSLLLTAIAALSMLMLLQSHVRERLSDYALVRAMGGSWWQIACLVIGQNLMLAGIAILLTYAGLAVAFYTQSWWLPAGLELYADIWWSFENDWNWLGLNLVLGLFAGIGPWIWLQKIPLHRALVDS